MLKYFVIIHLISLRNLVKQYWSIVVPDVKTKRVFSIDSVIGIDHHPALATKKQDFCEGVGTILMPTYTKT